jgi:hypothetical protein
MTEPEDFLTRWSRRKREAGAEAEPKADREQQRKGEQRVATDMQTPRPPQTNDRSDESKSEDVFDLSKLPSLDSIGPATDIRVFLQPGVPEALSRAALRRAWSADPAIRDFIGPSENSWDFTASDGMHGFGALDPMEAKRLVERLLGVNDDKDEPAASEDKTEHAGTGTEQAREDTADLVSVPAGNGETPPDDRATAGTNEMPQVSNPAPAYDAVQQECVERERTASPVRRIHGRALPQ